MLNAMAAGLKIRNFESVKRIARKIRARIKSTDSMFISQDAWDAAISSAEKPDHFGSKLSIAIEAALLNPKPKGMSAEYDLIKPHFDLAYYFARYPDIFTKGIDPVAHYIIAGAQEGRNPSPVFSTSLYRQRYPEVTRSGLTPFGHWISRGRADGYIAEPFDAFSSLSEAFGYQLSVSQELLQARHHDVRARLIDGPLGEQVRKISSIEPMVASSWPAALDANIPPFRSELVTRRSNALSRLQQAVDFCRKRAVILVNRPRWGLNPRAEGFLGRSLCKLISADQIVVIYTDKAGPLPTGKFPDGVVQILFPEYIEKLDDRQRLKVLTEFIRSMRPEFVFSVNSRAFWGVIERYGQALSREMRLVPYFFCDEESLYGYRTGYPLRYFYRAFPLADQVVTDSHYLAERFQDQYLVPTDERNRIRVVSAPCDPDIKIVEPERGMRSRRAQVFWAGRFDNQKRLDIVYRIAERMPEVDFQMWGETVLGGIFVASKPSNVFHHGKYASYDEVPLAEADAWLYTSAWDGVPNQLIELGMMGMPIVGSLVAGTGEILKPEFSWPVSDFEDVDAYVAAIREVLRDPSEARRRGALLREYLLRERHPDRHVEQVRDMITATPRFGVVP